jgi:hypothetical protein
VLAVNYNWSNSPIEVPPLAHNLPSFVGLGITSTGMGDTELGIVGYYLFTEGPLALPQVQPLGRSEIMGILNIKYVVILNDAIKGPYSNPVLDLQITKNMSNLVLERQVGSISIYRNLRYKPVVYIPKNIVIMQANNAYEFVASAMEVENLNISDVVYLDKETFRALNFENARPIKLQREFKNVIDTNQASFWKPYVEGVGSLGPANLSNDLANKFDENASLRISIGAGTYATSYIVHDFETPQDWSEQNLIALNWFGRKTGQRISLLLYTPDLPPKDYNYFKWSFVDEINQMGASTNRVDIKRISYDQYQIHVYNASDPLFLVLSDSYSPSWTLSIQNRSEKNIDVKHFKANLYANGWLISGVNGDLTINLEYTSRKYFNLSLLVFSVYFIVSTSYLLLYVIRHNSNFANRITKNRRKS